MSYHIFIGWDPKDDLASKVAIRSLLRYRKDGLKITFLRDHEMRRAGYFWRRYEVCENGQMIDAKDGKPFSTGFSFSRFCVPELARSLGIKDPVMFVDPDVMFRADVKELFDLWDGSKAVMCVQHDHIPAETEKFDGFLQTKYFRKNWSSLMLIDPNKTEGLNAHKVNNWTGSQLHGLLWAKDEEIGALPAEWNHLVGYNEPNPNAKIVHFTLGTPDIAVRPPEEHAEEWWSYVDKDEYEAIVKPADLAERLKHKAEYSESISPSAVNASARSMMHEVRRKFSA